MFDFVPTRVWLLIGIAAAAYVPTSYLLRYVRHSPRHRDVTQPPEDLGWRTWTHFWRSMFAVAALVALAIFIFTPAAEDFARGDWFAPSLLVVFGGFGGWSVVKGFLTGTIEPAVRGFQWEFARKSQPRRFWASMAWNATLSLMMIGLAGVILRGWPIDKCDNPGERLTAQEAVTACTSEIDKREAGDPVLSQLYVDRGYQFLARAIRTAL